MAGFLSLSGSSTKSKQNFYGFKYNEKIEFKTSETQKRDEEIDRISGIK
jgi:hypothetical protein